MNVLTADRVGGFRSLGRRRLRRRDARTCGRAACETRGRYLDGVGHKFSCHASRGRQIVKEDRGMGKQQIAVVVVGFIICAAAN
jgi:hypothetical protein